jgi:hypothetical protein
MRRHQLRAAPVRMHRLARVATTKQVTVAEAAAEVPSVHCSVGVQMATPRGLPWHLLSLRSVEPDGAASGKLESPTEALWAHPDGCSEAGLPAGRVLRRTCPAWPYGRSGRWPGRAQPHAACYDAHDAREVVHRSDRVSRTAFQQLRQDHPRLCVGVHGWLRGRFGWRRACCAYRWHWCVDFRLRWHCGLWRRCRQCSWRCRRVRVGGRGRRWSLRGC